MSKEAFAGCSDVVNGTNCSMGPNGDQNGTQQWDPTGREPNGTLCKIFREKVQTLAAAGAVLACKVIWFIILVLEGIFFLILLKRKYDSFRLTF